MRYDDVVKVANELVRQHGEVTVRQIYYILYSKGYYRDYANSRSFYNSYDRVLVTARERGDVSARKVIDTVRATLGGDDGFKDMDTFLEGWLNSFLNGPERYSRLRWRKQDATPIIWVEKDALARIIHSVADEFKVETCPSRGYSSLYYIMKKVNTHDNLVLLHFADHDPSGLDMTRDLAERAYRYSGHEIPVKRIALTSQQVKEYDLTPNPTKRADSRAGKYQEVYGDKCWELDALPPDVLKGLVRDAILNEIDTVAWADTERIEQEEREKLRKIFSDYRRLLNEFR